MGDTQAQPLFNIFHSQSRCQLIGPSANCFSIAPALSLSVVVFAMSSWGQQSSWMGSGSSGSGDWWQSSDAWHWAGSWSPDWHDRPAEGWLDRSSANPNWQDWQEWQGSSEHSSVKKSRTQARSTPCCRHSCRSKRTRSFIGGFLGTDCQSEVPRQTTRSRQGRV